MLKISGIGRIVAEPKDLSKGRTYTISYLDSKNISHLMLLKDFSENPKVFFDKENKKYISFEANVESFSQEMIVAIATTLENHLTQKEIKLHQENMTQLFGIDAKVFAEDSKTPTYSNLEIREMESANKIAINLLVENNYSKDDLVNLGISEQIVDKNISQDNDIERG